MLSYIRPRLQGDRRVPGLEKSKSEYEVFKIYPREYKKRFAWIRAGRITKDEFYSWREKAREKKAECEEGKITLEEFGRWLKIF